MGQRKRIRYQMNFEGNSHFYMAVLLGIAFFLRIAFYLGFSRPEQVGFVELILFLILPVLLEAAFIVLLRVLRYSVPGVYGIMGMAYCLLLVLQTFQYGDLVRTILGILAYVACGGLLLGTVGGMLSKDIVVTAVFVTAAVRLLVFDLGKYIFSFHLVEFLPELAALCGLCAIGLFAQGLRDPKTKSNQ